MPEQPDDAPRAVFARNVRAWRERREMTQEALGWAAGLHQTEIARVERGTRNPGLETIVKIARALDVAPAELLSGMR